MENIHKENMYVYKKNIHELSTNIKGFPSLFYLYHIITYEFFNMKRERKAQLI